jgi:hypothetical protein
LKQAFNYPSLIFEKLFSVVGSGRGSNTLLLVASVLAAFTPSNIHCGQPAPFFFSGLRFMLLPPLMQGTTRLVR